MKVEDMETHNAKEISRIYDALISLTKRLDKLEKDLRYARCSHSFDVSGVCVSCAALATTSRSVKDE